MEGSSEFIKKDGVYSWLVFITILVNSYCCMGYVFCSAALYSAVYPDLLEIDQLKANTISSVLVGVFLSTIPISTLMLSIYGCRALAGISIPFTLAGVLSSAFATQFWHMILGFSVIGGFGMSMNTTALVGIVPHYFDMRKSAAYAAPGLGSGLAIVTFPYIVSSLLQNYGYKYGVLYLSPLFLVTLMPLIVFRPQFVLQKPESKCVLFRAYVAPFKKLVTPFFLANACILSGGYVSLVVVLFSYIASKSRPSVAILSVSLIGVGRVVASIFLCGFLMKFKINHFVLHIISSALLGVSSLFLAFFHDEIGYYILSAAIGVSWGTTISNIPCLAYYLYPPRQVEYAFGFHSIVGGIAAFIAPVTTGVIQIRYGDTAGLCYISAHGFVAAFVLVLVALLQPELWSPYRTTAQSQPEVSDNKDHTQQNSEEMTSHPSTATSLPL